MDAIKISKESLDAFKSGNELSSHFGYAIQYVRENADWSKACEEYALENMNERRCSIEQASDEISNKICDLMDEYGVAKGLPDDWWHEYGSVDDIFFKL